MESGEKGQDDGLIPILRSWGEIVREAVRRLIYSNGGWVMCAVAILVTGVQAQIRWTAMPEPPQNASQIMEFGMNEFWNITWPLAVAFILFVMHTVARRDRQKEAEIRQLRANVDQRLRRERLVGELTIVYTEALAIERETADPAGISLAVAQERLDHWKKRMLEYLKNHDLPHEAVFIEHTPFGPGGHIEVNGVQLDSERSNFIIHLRARMNAVRDLIRRADALSASFAQDASR